MLACALSGAGAQDTSTPPAETPQPPSDQQTQQPVPAYGQDNAPPLVNENPPLSGMDLPSLEPHAAPLSYLQPGATVSESADSNALDTVGGGSSFSSITRGLGSLDLKRLWSNYDLALDYVGGAAYYSVRGQGWKLLQQMDVDQKISWKRGQLSLRDSFSYLPEGNFGGSYGSLGSQGIGSLGNTSFGAFFGGSALGSLGLASARPERGFSGRQRKSYAEVHSHRGGGIRFHSLLRKRLLHGHPVSRRFADFGARRIQPDPDFAYPNRADLWLSGLRLLNLWSGVPFPRDPGNVRASHFWTVGLSDWGRTADYAGEH